MPGVRHYQPSGFLKHHSFLLSCSFWLEARLSPFPTLPWTSGAGPLLQVSHSSVGTHPAVPDLSGQRLPSLAWWLSMNALPSLQSRRGPQSDQPCGRGTNRAGATQGRMQNEPGRKEREFLEVDI